MTRPRGCVIVRSRLGNGPGHNAKGDTMRYTVTVERTAQGFYRMSTVVGGYLFTRQYGGYSKRDALRDFKAQVLKADGGAR